MFPFENILNYIADEQCALVIGPEIMHFEGKAMNMYLRDKVYAQFKDQVKHYYENDGLFLFSSDNASAKSGVAKALKNECFRLPGLPGYNEDLLKHIARLPFHLIISINPDNFLPLTFKKFGVRHRFSHFRKGDRPSDNVDKPTRAEPLIYNIAGSILEDESLILDYDDLFSLISSSIGASGLPNGLQTALTDIRTYIFVGFPFEKWHTHVMLRILCGKASYQKYAGPHRIGAETYTFLANQFKIEFWQPEAGDLWDEFIKAATAYRDPNPERANQPFLRELLAKAETQEIVAIMQAVENGKIQEAIDLLLAYSRNTPFEIESVQISARYQILMQRQTSIDSRDFQTTLNQNIEAILNLARQIANSK